MCSCFFVVLILFLIFCVIGSLIESNRNYRKKQDAEQEYEEWLTGKLHTSLPDCPRCNKEKLHSSGIGNIDYYCIAASRNMSRPRKYLVYCDKCNYEIELYPKKYTKLFYMDDYYFK